MPFGRDPSPLWAQHYLVDKGATLGPTLGLFRAAFFTEQPNPWDPRGFKKDYTFKRAMQPQLSRVLQHRSITYTADECIDLPPIRRLMETVRLPPEMRDYYTQIVDQAIAAKGDMQAMTNAFLRLRQLSSGYIGLKDDETGARAELEFDTNPKLDRLLDLVRSLPGGAKAVIFYEFTRSGRKIVEALQKELKVSTIWLWSGTKNAKTELARFTDGPALFAVINNKVGAYSLDGLQVAHYEFFFESPLSAQDREQAERRLRRQGQQARTVFVYDLICMGTVDAKILEFHSQGRELFAALLKNPSAVLR
jgi:SNF2 family DNA or RNA helicase